MADVTFVYSSTTATLPAPDHPEEVNENLIQKRSKEPNYLLPTRITKETHRRTRITWVA